MVEAAQRYPLQWPHGRKRRTVRKDAQFNKKVDSGKGYLDTKSLSVADAMKRLMDELDRINARNTVLSTNLELRLDGTLRSDRSPPADPGVALYFSLGDKPHCMPCDTYNRVADNIAAIAAHVNATRLIERHGVATVAEMFTGFEALPAPGKADSQQWFHVLGFDTSEPLSEEIIRKRYRRLAMERAGSEHALRELNVARDEALKVWKS